MTHRRKSSFCTILQEFFTQLTTKSTPQAPQKPLAITTNTIPPVETDSCVDLLSPRSPNPFSIYTNHTKTGTLAMDQSVHQNLDQLAKLKIR